jgi:aconitate hydratase
MAYLSFDTLRPLPANGKTLGQYHSLPALEKHGLGAISRMPFSLRIVLESLVRNADGNLVSEDQLRQLAAWQPRGERTQEIPFILARIVAPDSSGVPLLADLAAMRDVAQRKGFAAEVVEPVVQVDLIVDHSVQVDRAGSADALLYNMREEYRRNEERYIFLKWAARAFKGFKIIPPGVGIIHQINLEQLARGVWQKNGVYYPDTLVGTDSHTSMVNGIGVLGWGVGGIEAEAAMLGQPVYFLTPDVVGVELTGKLNPGITATDLVLTVVQTLRRAKVVGKFVEFFGEGAAQLPAPDRCTISNMSPEYGATAAYFPVDDITLDYLRCSGRTEAELEALKAYYEAQEMYGMPRAGDIDYTDVIRIDLSSIVPSVAGPRRPEDRIALSDLSSTLTQLFPNSAGDGGFARPLAPRPPSAPGQPAAALRDGDVVLAAITSCTNTSNPGVLLAAGLLAKKAVEKGLKVNPRIKTSFTPGSRVVDAYLSEAGLLPYLETLGFNVVGFGCTTCMGNSGPIEASVEADIAADDLIVAAVLSGNRNFEARIHPAIKANFLMSPPLVVAFALAGRIDFDMNNEPLGYDKEGHAVFLRDIWPSSAEIEGVMKYARDPAQFRRLYSDFHSGNELWKSLSAPDGMVFDWDPESTYLRRPPFFDDFEIEPAALSPLRGARALAVLGDSVTTDHINPGSDIGVDTIAGAYLREHGVTKNDFNSYIARRSNHEVMMRGAFANVRLRNLMVPGVEGGVTVHQPDGTRMSIYDASMQYAKEKTPLVVLAGEEYGIGSSRDWAAKGPSLLGVRAVIARGFERIHRSNLVGMGVLPCQFTGTDSIKTLKLDGSETYELVGVENGVQPLQALPLKITRTDGSVVQTTVTARIDTPIESVYFTHGGILQYVLRGLLSAQEEAIA